MFILDAKTMKPISEIPLPTHIPYQSHGNWFPSLSEYKDSKGFHVKDYFQSKQQ